MHQKYENVIYKGKTVFSSYFLKKYFIFYITSSDILLFSFKNNLKGIYIIKQMKIGMSVDFINAFDGNIYIRKVKATSLPTLTKKKVFIFFF